MLICIGLGFVSGLPLYLLIQLVPAWLRLEGVSLTAIGFFTAIQYPYSLKFLWSPAVERYSVPLLGRRRGWMLLTQALLMVTISMLGWWNPQDALISVTAVAVSVAVFSATQDIVIDAYRRELLRTEGELALGNTVFVQAYRIAGLVPGSLGMILAGHLPWETVFPIMAAFIAVGVVLTLLIREAQSTPEIPGSLRAAVTEPFREFFGRRGYRAGLAVLAFMFLYKLGDNMATVLATPFYIDMGFTTTDIGLIAKNAALWPAIVGGVIGGLIIVKIGINRGLWLFGFVQLGTIFGFVWLSEVGAVGWVLAVVISAEYLGVGLGTAASVAYIARETAKTAVATQFALFTALAALPRVLSSSVSGLIVDHIGWTSFFYLCAVLAVPGMVLLYWAAPFNAPIDRDAPRAPAASS
ncbi:MAG: AmpG family muropeptide MFS transporter [Pseudomonadales bacterium]|jgi:PAT family beta-lactamase induction signal transducer AmpG